MNEEQARTALEQLFGSDPDSADLINQHMQQIIDENDGVWDDVIAAKHIERAQDTAAALDDDTDDDEANMSDEYYENTDETEYGDVVDDETFSTPNGRL